jgi:hypothetical protein
MDKFRALLRTRSDSRLNAFARFRFHAAERKPAPLRARVADKAHFRAPSASEGARKEILSDRARARERRSNGETKTAAYSHSIVPGGLDVMSNVTRFTCTISLIIREATFSSRS